MRRKAFFLPSVITAFALSCGLFALFRASLVPQGLMTESLLISLTGIILIAAIADVLDGAVARAMKLESEFGGFFDSLSDAVTFGVAPSLIVVKSIPYSSDGSFPFMLLGAAMIFAMCGVLRLVRFNVQRTASQQDEQKALEHKKNFTGLPIPAGCAAALGANLLLHTDYIRDHFSPKAILWIQAIQLLLLGYLMVSQWKFPSIKTFRIPVRSFKLVFITVAFALFILYGLVSEFALVLFVASWGYIILSLVLTLIRFFLGKKSKTLEEFEPDPEEDDFA